MNLRLRLLLSKQTLTNLTRITSTSSAIVTPHWAHNNTHDPTPKPLGPTPLPRTQINHFYSSPFLNSSLSSAAPATASDEEEDEDEAALNEFLSRFVHIMRGNLNESYPDCDKPTIDAMLLVIVDKLVSEMEKGGSLEEKLLSGGPDDLSQDLWRTVWEVSNSVYKEMEREKKKEKMKKFLQSEEVKAMARFASEVGVRGDMLHELRFEWANDAMEKAELYKRLAKAGEAGKEEERERERELESAEASGGSEERADSGGLPKRHGKIKYKLYGLDLSGVVWKEVADKVHEAEEVLFPQEGKPISGKCKIVTEKILGLGKHEDFDSVVAPLLDEWKELLQPSRADWIALLEKVKERDCSLYSKVLEHVLDEPSFQANIRDYSKLIDTYAKENRTEDIERILKKMSESGMAPDTIILTSLLHMYCKENNLEQASAAYDTLMSQGFKPDMKVYDSMIMLYVNAGKPKLGEKLTREMELRDIKPTENMYMSLLRAFAKNGDNIGAQRVVTLMQFAGFQQTAESCALLIEACGRASNPSEARKYFDEMMDLGFKPDDRCTSNVISAYEKKNELGKALHLLLLLEKNGFEPGVLTYSVLVDWLGKLQLVDEVEQMLTKIAQLGEAPPFKIQVSLCDMYVRANMEKKALQALGVLEAKKDLLEHQDFERIIQALLKGGYVQEAQRIQKVMEAQGFTPSDNLTMSLMAAQSFSGGRRPGMTL